VSGMALGPNFFNWSRAWSLVRPEEGAALAGDGLSEEAVEVAGRVATNAIMVENDFAIW
jgi:hypothetical protein